MKILVAGLGNKYMGDDGFGPRVIEALMEMNLPIDVELRDVGICNVTLAPDLADYELVIFVDAVKGGKAIPGTIYRNEIDAEHIKKLKPEEALDAFTFSIHETSLEELILFAKMIGTLPKRIIFIGCEVKDVKLGDKLNSEVKIAVRRASKLIFEELWKYCKQKRNGEASVL